MKQLVLILASLEKKVDVSKIKKEVISYVGMRMVDNTDENVPGVLLKFPLGYNDMKELSGLMPAEASLIFIDMRNEDSCESFLAAVEKEDYHEEQI